ncbi:diguanylate cyclase, partial [Dolichospermum sp. ST_con]|nr:diguanylate cyclase [Dolichospermum sp. ST_con]
MMKETYQFPPRCHQSIDYGTDDYFDSLEHLLTVIQDLYQACSLEQIMDIALDAARKITKSDGAVFVLLDHGFCYYANENSTTPLWKGQRIPLNLSIAGGVMLNNKPIIFADGHNNDDTIGHNFHECTFVKSMVMVSLCNHKQKGTIGLYWHNYHQPSIETVKLLQTIADITLVTMENFQLYSELEKQLRDRTAALERANTLLQKEMQKHKILEAEIRLISLTDGLTGMHNRQGFFLLAQQQIRLAKRSQTNVSILLIELVGLKNIQDTWGQEYGDDTILSAARLLKNTCRTSDTIGRIEPAEFVVLVQGCEPDCQIIKQRLQNALDQFNTSQQQPFPLAMNVGIQTCDSQSQLPLDDLITLAQINISQSRKNNSEGTGN